MWIRILGRGKVQQAAIDEIESLPADSPYRDETLKLFVKLKITLESRNDREPNETELMMRLAESPLFVKYMERVNAKTRIESFQSVVEGLMLNRFGVLDEELAATIPNIVELPPVEFTSLLLQLNRQELIDRFTDSTS